VRGGAGARCGRGEGRQRLVRGGMWPRSDPHAACACAAQRAGDPRSIGRRSGGTGTHWLGPRALLAWRLLVRWCRAVRPCGRAHAEPCPVGSPIAFNHASSPLLAPAGLLRHGRAWSDLQGHVNPSCAVRRRPTASSPRRPALGGESGGTAASQVIGNFIGESACLLARATSGDSGSIGSCEAIHRPDALIPHLTGYGACCIYNKLAADGPALAMHCAQCYFGFLTDRWPRRLPGRPVLRPVSSNQSNCDLCAHARTETQREREIASKLERDNTDVEEK
jgi:hypothetical protein